jgi:hypothetical protein
MTEIDMVESWLYGPLPVIETWIDCRHTKAGWCGRRKSDGAPVNITYDPRDYGGHPGCRRKLGYMARERACHRRHPYRAPRASRQQKGPSG